MYSLRKGTPGAGRPWPIVIPCRTVPLACAHLITTAAFLCSLLWLAAASEARAQAPPSSYQADSPLVRVDLSRFGRAASVVVRAVPGARLLGPLGTQVDSGPGPWTLHLSAEGVVADGASGRLPGVAAEGAAWRVQPGDGDAAILLSAAGGGRHRYRGAVEIGVNSGRLRVVNDVSLEDYIRSVVVCEMGGRAPMEALKAQAVASRTYALYVQSRSGGQATLEDTSASQVYGGMDFETAQASAAVAATTGQILVVEGAPIAAQYCTDCGGYTAPGRTPDACPHAVDDSEAHAASETLRRAVWTLRYSPEKLSAIVGSAALAPVSLRAVDVIETDVSGRVRRLRLTWAPSAAPASPAAAPPSAPPPQAPGPTESPSQTPSTTPQSAPASAPGDLAATVTREIAGNTLRNLLGWDTLRSTRFTVRRDADGTFVIEGRGWGHGHGMCQLGAVALASPPLSRDYRSILLHYYDGAVLTTVSYSDPEIETGFAQTLPDVSQPSAAPTSGP